MHENSHLTVFWLMDSFGHLLHHDPVRDTISHRRLRSFTYPSLSFLLPTPLIFPLHVPFSHPKEILTSLPPLEFIADPQTNAVGLYQRQRNKWLSSDPLTEMTHLHAPGLGPCEKFLLLDLPLLNGISHLLKPTNIHITSPKLPPNTELSFNFDKKGAHHASLSGFSFDLKKNLPFLRLLGTIEPQEKKEILLKGHDFNILPLLIQRNPL